jgi:hypothetical protein
MTSSGFALIAQAIKQEAFKIVDAHQVAANIYMAED